MASVSRERIALVVFVLLVFFGIGLLVAYLNIGHNWNVTASRIDDATGELEGYTVILYAGTVEEPAEEAPTAASASDDAQGAARSELGTDEGEGASHEGDGGRTGSDGAGALAEAGSDRSSDLGSSASAADAAEASVASEAAREQEDDELSAEAPSVRDDGAASSEGSIDPSGASSSSASGERESSESSTTSSRMVGGATPLFASSSSSSQEKDPVSVEDVAASYREKDAQVLVIDVDDLGAYAEGLILKRGDRRIGVFSIVFNEPLPRVQAKVVELRAASVDFVVAITPDRQFVESATGIDIALSLADEGSSFLGGTVDGTFYVDSPLVGQVGAVLVSPHNVVSAKDVTEL